MPKQSQPDIDSDAGPALHSARWRFGDFELDESQRELRYRGNPVEIEKKPLSLLMVFLRHPGQLLTKNDLLEAVWAGRIVVEAALGSAVAKLRDALGEAGTVWLKTVHGFGYRFDAPVELITDETGATAPPRLSFNAGDVPPGRPNWQLLSRLGSSGDSWLAEHVKTKARRVFKFTSEPLGLSALKREVTVFRLLRESVGEKACYVDVLDWNFDDPPWFIEAEYCPGGSLQEWFAQHGGIRNVPLEVRLDLIAQIAEALAEIHIVGVLHKDLKPANVFVVINAEGKPTIRLGDFGSSRLVDATRIAALEITRMGFTQVIEPGSDTSTGTPLYFAPEVLAGQPVTVKADIYALGVMLYQFVVGNISRRLDAGWEANVQDELLREDIGVAANGNPELRLADALELARRIRSREQRQKALEEQRAAQRLKEQQERQRDFAKARRIGLLLAAASLVVGMFATTLFALRAENAREQAEKDAGRARAVGGFLARGMFASINDDVKKVRDLTVKELLDRAVATLPSQFETDSEIKAEIHQALGGAYETLDYAVEADQQLRAADALLVHLHGESDARRIQIISKRIILSYSLGNLRQNLDDFKKFAADVKPDSDNDRADAAALGVELIRGKMLLGEYSSAIIDIKNMLEGAAGLARPVRVSLRRLLGVAYMEIAEFELAEAVMNATLADEISKNGPNTRISMALLCNLAAVDVERGKIKPAEEHLAAARKIADQWLRSGSGWDVVINTGLARVSYLKGDVSSAVIGLREAVDEIRNQTAGAYDQSIESALQLAEIYNNEDRSDDARSLLLDMLDRIGDTLPDDSLKIARIRVELARSSVGLKQFNEAEQLLKQVSSAAEPVLPRQAPFFAKRDLVDATLATNRDDSSADNTVVAGFYERVSTVYYRNHPYLKFSKHMPSRFAYSR